MSAIHPKADIVQHDRPLRILVDIVSGAPKQVSDIGSVPTFVGANWMSALCQFETHALEHSRDAVIAQHVQSRIDRSSP